jgi:hypothetical protein
VHTSQEKRFLRSESAVPPKVRCMMISSLASSAALRVVAGCSRVFNRMCLTQMRRTLPTQ